MQFTPYSFSKINTFVQCPRKFELSYIEKIKLFTPNLATERGSYIHLLLENETKKQPTKFTFNAMLPSHQQECHKIFENFLESDLGKYFDADLDVEAEVEFGIKLTKDGFDICSYYDKDALFRGKIDHAIVREDMIELLDWKTGKVSFFPAPLQLIMYAVWAFIKYPHINTVRTAFVYVEHLQEKEYVFKREHQPALLKKVAERLTEIEMAKTYPKQESKLCEYCNYRKEGYCDPETNDEFLGKMDSMIKNYTPKSKDSRQGLKKDLDVEFEVGKGGIGIKQDVYYFAHYASDCLWRQDHDEIEYQDGEVEEVSKELWHELKSMGWVETYEEIQTKQKEIK